MRVKLLQDILEGGRIKVQTRTGYRTLVYSEGTVLDMSEGSAKKYIEKGWAEATDDPLERLRLPREVTLDNLTLEERQQARDEAKRDNVTIYAAGERILADRRKKTEERARAVLKREGVKK